MKYKLAGTGMQGLGFRVSVLEFRAKLEKTRIFNVTVMVFPPYDQTGRVM